VVGHRGGYVVLMESEKCLRKTSDEAPLRRGGGKKYVPLTLPREPALRPVLNLIQDLFQGRLLWPANQRKGLFCTNLKEEP
jgi:hypothetical protein